MSNTEPQPVMYESFKTQGNKTLSIQWNVAQNEQVHWKLKKEASKKMDVLHSRLDR